MSIVGAELENFTIDQFAGSLALVLGSIGGLLMIIWKSRCHCKINLCYICQCERKPPDNENNNSESEGEETIVPPANNEGGARPPRIEEEERP